MRENLVRKISKGERLFPGIIGFDETVIPQLQNAILSGHDIVLLGERGQGKSRLMRGLVSLLDAEVPAVAGCPIRDDPLRPVCAECRGRIAEAGPDTPIDWVARESRYAEKLATPDVTIADLIGEVDPIKVAEGRYLSNESTIHFGLVPRSNRGIFALNELPDLAEKIQVGLFNVLEERDVQIRGFSVRLILDLFVVATANPEDYTNRGRIVTPLKDRFGSQIRTHYPLHREQEVTVVAQERRSFGDEECVAIPGFMGDLIVEIARQARVHPRVYRDSGVSVRASIHNTENAASNAVRRRLALGEACAVPRISDLASVIPSTQGKLELDPAPAAEEQSVVAELIRNATREVFDDVFRDHDFSDFLDSLGDSRRLIVGDRMPAGEYERQLKGLRGWKELSDRLGVRRPEEIASALEFVLEGLHLRGRLGKEEVRGEGSYYRRQ